MKKTPKQEECKNNLWPLNIKYNIQKYNLQDVSHE